VNQPEAAYILSFSIEISLIKPNVHNITVDLTSSRQMDDAVVAADEPMAEVDPKQGSLT
jgi:hypothetical protein